MADVNFEEPFLKLCNLIDRIHMMAIKKTQKSHVETLETLTHRQGQAMFIIASIYHEQPEGLRMTELARRLHMSLPATSVLVEAMVQKNIFMRAQGTKDRRIVYVTLSSQGADNFEKIRCTMKETIAKLMGSLSSKEKSTFVDIVTRFYEIIPEEE